MATRKSVGEKSQLARFKEAARDADAEMSKEEFSRVIGKVAKPNPETLPKQDSDQEPDDQT